MNHYFWGVVQQTNCVGMYYFLGVVRCFIHYHTFFGVLNQQLGGTNCLGMYHSFFGWFNKQTVWVCMLFCGSTFHEWYFGGETQQDIRTICSCHWTQQHYGAICVLVLQVIFMNMAALLALKHSTYVASMSSLRAILPSMCSIAHSAALGTSCQFHSVS